MPSLGGTPRCHAPAGFPAARSRTTTNSSNQCVFGRPCTVLSYVQRLDLESKKSDRSMDSRVPVCQIRSDLARISGLLARSAVEQCRKCTAQVVAVNGWESQALGGSL